MDELERERAELALHREKAELEEIEGRNAARRVRLKLRQEELERVEENKRLVAEANAMTTRRRPPDVL